MTVRIEDSPLFTPWRDPVSGVESYLLTRRVAPVQQSLYFTNSGFSDDGRFLWFYCAFPPGGDAYYGRQLAVADLAEQRLVHFPETQFMDGSPCVDGATGEAYWATGLEVWKRPAQDQGGAVLVGSFASDLARNRRPLRIATHLTRSADGCSFAIDAQLGDEWFVGDLPIDGSGPFRLWQRFDRCFNHAQFSPIDPDLMLIAQDYWHDAASGAPGTVTDRLWLIRRGGRAAPIFPSEPSDKRGHEWWDPDGHHVWYVHYGVGTERVDIRDGGRVCVWPGRPIHAHAERSGRFLVSDSTAGPDAWRVTFFNAQSGREIDIVTSLPPAQIPRGRYHLHPHPRFCLDDRYICYTTNVRGCFDVAVIPVDRLVERTG